MFSLREPAMMPARIRVWDLPVRLFHWLLVVAVSGAIVTGQLGGNLMEWHGRIGLAIAGLLAFRTAWGLLGTTYARFAQFLPTPARLQAHLRGAWHGEGHNPLGAVSVFALLGVLAIQVLCGLAANDDIAFEGPLFDLAGKELSDRLTGVHHLLADGLLILIALHIGAIVFYAVFRRRNLVKPMITGWKEGEGKSATGGGVLPALAALLFAGIVVYGASGAWIAKPPPAATAETPKW